MPHPGYESLLRSAANDAKVISFAGGLPAPETFPRKALGAAAMHAAQSFGHDALQYDWSEGRPALREHIAARLRARGADVVADDVIVTNGAQQALALVLDVLEPPAVQVDPESYSSALQLFRGRGCAPRASEKLALRYAMPAIDNPWGRAMRDAERAEVLDARWVIEDDAYADLRFDGPSLPPLLAEARAKVFHVGSFSKTLSPGLRVGWLVPPKRWRERIKKAKNQRDLQTSGLAQSVVERYLAHTDFDARLARLRGLYGARAAKLTQALREHPALCFVRPAGGFSVWVETTRVGSEADLLARALTAGVAFEPGSLFRCHPRRAIAMRLSFSSLEPSRYVEGVRRLAGLF